MTGETVTGIVTDAVKQFVENQKKEWKHDRQQTIGASEIGQCARKIFCMKFEDIKEAGVIRNPGFVDTWGARERGNLIEKHLIVPAMKKRYGDAALFIGEDQQTFFDGYLSATPDCILKITADEFVAIEFKTSDPRANLDQAKPEHVYQTQIQMGILNHLGTYPCDRAIISYTDASFLNETREFEIRYDRDYYRAGCGRAIKIMHSFKMTDLPPEGWIAGGKECEYCPFSIACLGSRRAVPEANEEKLDPQFVAEIADLAKTFKFAQMAVDTSEKQMRELQHEIKTRLQDKKVRRVVGNGVSVSWSPVRGREITDVKALRDAAAEAGINLDLFTSQGEAGDRLTVSLKEKS